MSKTTRKIMVCVSGMSPAVITETLYALVTEKEFVPDEIHVITTAEGKTKIEEKLLQEGNGWFHRFMNEYLPNEQIRFDTGTIHLISKDGNTLKDITTDEENRAAADTIYRVLRQIKSQAGTQMHVSIAGGRKSMGFYMGHAFSLVADEADTLSHVLVSHPFENPKLDFYYPPKDAKEYLLEGKVWNSTMAKVSLAEVAALKLGKLFELGVPEKAKQSFEFAVQIVQAVTIAPVVHVGLHESKQKIYLETLGERFELSPEQSLIWLIVAWGCKHGCENVDMKILNQPEIKGLLGDTTFKTEFLQDIQDDALKIKRSKLKDVFKPIGPVVKWLEIKKRTREKGNNRYYIELPTNQLVFGFYSSDTQPKQLDTIFRNFEQHTHCGYESPYS